jgi:hypothetical protein
MRGYAIPLLAVLALCACRKDPPKDNKADEKASASLSADEGKAARKAKAPVDEGIDVPTEEDFEEAVASQITPESDLAKELDKLEKEIGQ